MCRRDNAFPWEMQVDELFQTSFQFCPFDPITIVNLLSVFGELVCARSVDAFRLKPGAVRGMQTRAGGRGDIRMCL